MAKTYAVTGVASGIGAEIARVLHQVGHTVIGFDLKPVSENVDRFIPLDLSDPASITQAAAQLDGKLDGLCNNAGLPPRDGWAERVLQVNFLGQRQFTNAMLPHLSEGGSIVNMASRAGGKWRENIAQNLRLAVLADAVDLPGFIKAEGIDDTRAYDLSKEAMILWTMALTQDLIARGLRANTISPGAVATGILDDFARAFGDRMTRNVARTGRPGASAEVAEVAAFLLSEKSAWIKGADIPVDGGMGGFNAADLLEIHGMKG